MSTLKFHCDDCIAKLGKPYEEVHKWLDEFASPLSGYLNVNHRRFRHHIDGIREVQRLFGDDAVKAAEIHIFDDCGRIPTRQEAEDTYPAMEVLIKFKHLKER